MITTLLASVFLFSSQIAPPTIQWTITPERVLGAPVYVQFRIDNPNPFPIVVFMGEPRTSWFGLRVQNADAPLAAVMPRTPLDELRPGDTQLIEAMSHCRRSFSLKGFVRFTTAGAYSASIHCSLAYRAKSAPNVEWLSPVVADDEMQFRVTPADDEALAAAADQMEKALTQHGVSPADGIEPGSTQYLLRDLLQMPVGPCAAIWRRLLFSGKLPGRMMLGEAAVAINSNPDPAAASFANEIRDYMARHKN